MSDVDWRARVERAIVLVRSMNERHPLLTAQGARERLTATHGVDPAIASIALRALRAEGLTWAQERTDWVQLASDQAAEIERLRAERREAITIAGRLLTWHQYPPGSPGGSIFDWQRDMAQAEARLRALGGTH